VARGRGVGFAAKLEQDVFPWRVRPGKRQSNFSQRSHPLAGTVMPHQDHFEES